MSSDNGSSQGPLPFEFAELRPPSDDEMPGLIRHLRRGTAAARDRQARSAETRAFLDAGLRLVEQQLKYTNEYDSERGLLRFISRQAVLAEARKGNGDMGLSEGKYRDKWQYHSDYVADLIAYSLAARHWSLHVSESWSAHQLLTGEHDFVQAVHEVAYQDLVAVMKFPIYRFQLVAAATADRDPVVRQALRSMYDTITASWSALYLAVLEARGLALRPGITITEITDILSAVAEGLGLHLAADPDAAVLNHERHTSLLGTTALALFMSCVDVGDGHSQEDLMRLLLNKLDRYRSVKVKFEAAGQRIASLGRRSRT